MSGSWVQWIDLIESGIMAFKSYRSVDVMYDRYEADFSSVDSSSMCGRPSAK